MTNMELGSCKKCKKNLESVSLGSRILLTKVVGAG